MGGRLGSREWGWEENKIICWSCSRYREDSKWTSFGVVDRLWWERSGQERVSGLSDEKEEGGWAGSGREL